MNIFIKNSGTAAVVKRHVPWQSAAIHLTVLASLVISVVQIFQGGMLSRWSVGILYIVYDSILIFFTFAQIVRTNNAEKTSLAMLPQPTATVVVACFNQSSLLANTLTVLQDQIAASDRIVIADDGSTDELAHLLKSAFGLDVPDIGSHSSQGPLIWWRLAHGGKSNALNHALFATDTDLFVTVDADTVLDTGALSAIKDAFRRDANLIAATGILRPLCQSGIQGHIFQFFQKYEYMRNFLSRAAWARVDSLMLLSGAFSGYRTQAVKLIGGFDNTCIVEDYELTHRLMSYGFDHKKNWRTDVVRQAQATTMAPGTLPEFLQQRRRWFGGFLQTQLRYRHMVGNPAYGRVGTIMLPVKAVDTLQPLFGLTGLIILTYYVATANWPILKPFLVIIGCKLALDTSAITAFVIIFDKWTGRGVSHNLACAWLATIAEPFLFQPLRHVGALWGWLNFLSGDQHWKVAATKALSD